MTEEEGRATREDDRAPRHWKTTKADQQQTHPTALPGPVQQAARLEDLPSVLGTAELCRVLRTTRYRVRALVARGELRRLAYQPHKIQVAKAEVRRFLREQTESTGAA
jgi:hypothetical protein